MPSDGDRGTGHFSVAFPRRWWYPVCRSSSLGRRPLGVILMERPLALFRDGAGRPAAVLDRCSHRNAPLSLGSVHAGCIRCPYHGWRYDRDGRCREVPGLLADASSPTRDVEAHAGVEQDGFVWVWGEPGAEPVGRPFALPSPQEGTVFSCDLDCTLHAALENTLDVPHTAFLHRGIFRGTRPKELKAVRRDLDNGCEVEFVGEPVGLGRIQGGPLAGKVFEHWDRFFLPSIAQVEYRVESWLRIYNTVLHLPLSPFKTRAWFVLQWSSPIPAPLVRPIVRLRGRKVLRQDAGMLGHQSERIRRFGGERFASTELDVLGAAIWRLLRQAERAELGLVADDEAGPVPSPEISFRV
ncbi:MAG TPA: Rieske 2Fe-2S domain-containing protein [Acidimicrobiales bacterium]|nr:Rieske 2Fe-2S domain-containing protein [Acidimicrobiales bacterium]